MSNTNKEGKQMTTEHKAVKTETGSWLYRGIRLSYNKGARRGYNYAWTFRVTRLADKAWVEAHKHEWEFGRYGTDTKAEAIALIDNLYADGKLVG